MITNSDKLPVIAIAQARSFKENQTFYSRHNPLAARLTDYGAYAVALNGAKDYCDDDGTFLAHYTFDSQSPDLVFVDDKLKVDSAFDLSGGVALHATNVAALNPKEIRSITKLKQRQHDVLRIGLGQAVPFTLTKCADYGAIIDGLDEIQSEKVVIKFERDFDKKKGALIGDKGLVKAGLTTYLEGCDGTQDTLVIQEYMPETKADFVSGIRFFDTTEQDHAHKLAGYQRELRAHVIDNQTIVVSGRGGLDSPNRSPHDKILFLDPDSIPQHVYDLAQTAASLIRNAAGESNSYLAVDMTPDGRRIVEVNGRNIWTTRPDASRPGTTFVHKLMTDKLAEKLVSMAINKGKV